MTLALREQIPADEPFVRALLLETVAEQLGADAWPEPMRSHLLDMQVEMRFTSRRRQYPAGRASVISVDGQDAGWLFVVALEDEVRLADIVVASAVRGRGVATAVIGGVVKDARAAAKPVRLTVDAHSPAARLYERLGFTRCGGDELQHELECR